MYTIVLTRVRRIQVQIRERHVTPLQDALLPGWVGSRVGAKTAREVTPGGGTGAGLLGSVRGDPGGSDPLRFPQFTPKQSPIQSKSSE